METICLRIKIFKTVTCSLFTTHCKLELASSEHKTNLNTQLNNITKYGVWNNSEDLLYNGNEEFLATVDNYIKIAEAYESKGY